MVLHDGEQVTADMLPPPLNRPAARAAEAVEPAPRSTPSAVGNGSVVSGGPGAFASESEIQPLWKVERDVIERAIEACDGNIPKAAAKLGISPSTIYRKKLGWENQDAKS